MRFAYVIAAVLISPSLATVPLYAQSSACPPGQAKKSQDCKSQGKEAAKPSKAHKKPGSKIGNGKAIRDPSKYNLDPFGSYFRSGEFIYRVDRNTMEILDLVGRVQDLKK